MKRFNWALWGGLLLAVAAFLSYFAFFSQFPLTRDVPWVSALLFLVAAALLVTGWRRAPRKVLASIVTVLGFLVIGAFTFAILGTKNLPQSGRAPGIGQRAPSFALPDTQNRTVSLSDALDGSNGVLLVFYRGHW
jgi:MFS superfamily sulfate permease-like transporter